MIEQDLKGWTKVIDKEDSTLPPLNVLVETFCEDFPEEGIITEELVGNWKTNKSGPDWSESMSVSHWREIK